MAGSVTMDSAKFKRGISVLKKEYGIEAKDVMLRQMSIVAGQLAKRYPPNKQGTGKQAITNDLKRIMIPIPQEHEDTLTRWQDSMESTFDVFDDTGTRIEEWHRKHINPRQNRVTKSIKGKRFINGRDFSEKLHVRERDMKKYVNRVAKQVGKLKSGWVPGVKISRGFGALGAGKMPPGWVTRHTGNGSATTSTMRSNGSGYIKITNKIKGSARWKRIDAFVLKSRERGFQKELRSAIRKADKASNRV